MKKVLYLLNHAGKAGTERYVYSIIEKLHGSKIEAYFAYNEEGLLVERVKALGVETFRIEMKNPFDVKAVMELSALCKRIGIDLIHTQYLRENYIALLSRLLNPRVKVMYTNHFIMANNFTQRIFNRILTGLESNVIAVCNRGKEMCIRNGINKDKISVIFNGVDPDYWGELPESTLRSEFEIDENEFVILCVSRFDHDKGHRFLISSAAELKKMTKKRFRLVLANDGPLIDDCKEYAESMGIQKSIIFTGFRKDVKNLIAGSDIYVNSSEHEALSFAIIEMLAAGLPVIATNMGGNDDIINKSTNCGILVEYNDSVGLAKTILKLMEDPELQNTLKRNALVAIKEKFNLDNMVMKTYNLYMESK